MWSPRPDSQDFFGGGHTVLRGGFGIYYGLGQTEDQIQPIDGGRIDLRPASPDCRAHRRPRHEPADSIRPPLQLLNPLKRSVNRKWIKAISIYLRFTPHNFSKIYEH
jgi:hypothetical protein